jgi:hypothetical protein
MNPLEWLGDAQHLDSCISVEAIQGRRGFIKDS